MASDRYAALTAARESAIMHRIKSAVATNKARYHDLWKIRHSSREGQQS